MARPSILWVKSSVPWPLDQGNRFIAYNLIRHLSARFDITLVVPVRDARERANASELKPFCRVVMVDRPNTKSLVHRAAWSAALSARRKITYVPSEVFYENFGGLREAVRTEAASGRHDAAFLHYWFLYPLLDSLGDLPAAYLLHDNEPQRLESELAIHAGRKQDLERRIGAAVEGHEILARRASRLMFYSQEDLDDWTERSGARPANAVVFPYMFDFAPLRPRREVQGRILFTGHMSYGPNVDAVTWFVEHVLPLIRASQPTATFRIAGKLPSPEVQALAAVPGVEVTGYVDDMLDELTSASVFVVPIRYGGGLKIKLIEAGGQRCATVATTAALRGMGLTDGEHILHADEPEPMARAVTLLLGDASRRAALGTAMRDALVGRFAPRTAAPAVAELVESMFRARDDRAGDTTD